MGGRLEPSLDVVETGAFVRTACVSLSDPDPVGLLSAQLGPGPFALVTLFVSPCADFANVVAEAKSSFGESAVMACTTAGEISAEYGYCSETITAVAYPAAHFAAEIILFDNLDRIPGHDLIEATSRARMAIAQASPGLSNEFAFLMVDGLSRREDELTSALASGLGSIPLFGGSAGDGTDFAEAQVAYGGEIYSNAAVLALIRTSCEVRVFSLNHFQPVDLRMVVTRADPSRRIVNEINAEPAALEFGRILGKDLNQIDTFTFAANPVVVRLGGTHHVRAIKRVTEDGALEFFSAIDEGLVLTLAEAMPMVDHLRGELEALSKAKKPEIIVACDCILRRIEAEQKQLKRGLGALFNEFRVIGFSTYGEQVNGMHINQTMTGVALYPPSAVP